VGTVLDEAGVSVRVGDQGKEDLGRPRHGIDDPPFCGSIDGTFHDGAHLLRVLLRIDHPNRADLGQRLRLILRDLLRKNSFVHHLLQLGVELGKFLAVKLPEQLAPGRIAFWDKARGGAAGERKAQRQQENGEQKTVASKFHIITSWRVAADCFAGSGRSPIFAKPSAFVNNSVYLHHNTGSNLFQWTE